MSYRISSIEQWKRLRYPLAPGRQLLLKVWVGATLTVVLGIGAMALLWERQLPNRLRRSVASEDWTGCLQASEQLTALRWLGDGAPAEQALCRRRRAEQLWASGERAEALQLQLQLVQSGQADEADQQQLQTWRQELREQALAQFRAGDLDGAIALLEPLERRSTATGGSHSFSDSLRETWNRNRVEAERLDQLVQKERWWEALDSLNRLDHPWWQKRTKNQRLAVEEAIDRIGDSQEHHQHGSTHADVIAGDALNSAVQRQLQKGLDPWAAFEAGCQDLGGSVEEDGPESFCRRQSPEGA